jgi:uncharacterized protein
MSHRSLRPLLVFALLALTVGPAAQAQISLTTLGVPVTENFNGLSSVVATGVAWTDNTTVPGFYSTRTTYNVATGSSNAGALYSFGVAGVNPVTDRALGGIASGGTGTFYWAARYVNNTGATVNSFTVAFTGEQWRDGGNATPVSQPMVFNYQVANAGVITDADTPATGWLTAAALDFTSPVFTTTAVALDGNAAANRTAKNATLSVNVAPGQEIWIRWIDVNDGGNDHGLAVDDLSVTPANVVPPPTLSISDVGLAEGNAGTTNFTFAVTLSSPAPAGGVTFDIATADGTATLADNDYQNNSLTGQTIAAGNTGPYNFTVLVNGDTTVEANQTFFVNVSSVTGATVGDGQGQGTINNDDVTLTPIHDIQGPGSSSPIVGSSVSTRGVVTGVRSNGFFIQEPDATVDADPATSEGILVFGSPVPAAAVVGNLVQVTGTVAEFVPTQDVLQPPLTELTSATTIVISSGNPLPAAIPLTATFPDPAGPFDQLERLEGMRVSAASLTVGGPTLGSISEPNATATSQGVFFATITGVPRAFREAGIQAPDPPPAGSGTIPPIPRFDTNPEVIRVDSDNLVGTTAVDVSTGAVATNLVGPLDYTFRHYTINPETTVSFTGAFTPVAVADPTAGEFTVGAYNLQRFFDTINDPGIGEPVLTATAFDNRLNKASLGIRDFLKTPDIIGVVEVENLTTLQALAARISSDAIAASQPDPLYQAFLSEGNDVGGIDVGFLVKQQIVTGSTPRVTVLSVTQENLNEQLVNPDSSTDLLNDRPPLVLDAVINHSGGGTYPVVVIVNHLRSLGGVNDETPGSNGWPTGGARVRAKRHQQAVSLANLIQARQTADPSENIVILGDFNAFEVNDGYGHSMGTIQGTPVPDNETAVAGDGADLVNPDITNLFDTPPALDRYSYVFDGNAQSLDHLLVNSDLITSTVARRIEHPRINADFPEVAKNNTTNALRLADHDPVVGFFQVAGFASADLAVTKTDSPDPVTAGNNLTYLIFVDNLGPDPAATVSWSDTLPAGTTFVSLASPGGWTCTTPAIGAGGTITCSNPSVAVGINGFSLIVNVSPGVADGTVLSNTATATSTTGDPVSGNNSATATTTVNSQADLSITKSDSPDPVTAGQNLTYTIGVANGGPSTAGTVSWSDTLPAGTTFVSLSAFAGWSCTTPAVGAGGTVTCSIASLPPTGAGNWTLVVQVGVGVPASTVLSNTATLSSATTDPNPGNNSATATTTVGALADLEITKTASPNPVNAGANLTYTITVINSGPSSAVDAGWTDTLPAGTTFVSLASPAGWSCTTPAVGSGGTVTCTNALFAPGSPVFTLVVQVDPATPPSTITNTATATALTFDPDETQPATTETQVLSPASLSATKTFSGSTEPGGTVEYQIVITNDGPSQQGDYAGDELVDVLPPGLILTGATSTSPTVLVNLGTNTVTWNGVIPAGGTVTIDIEATIDPAIAPGSTISNQGTLNWDADGDGDNDATGSTDDPGAGGGADPTEFVVGGGVPPVEVPVLDARGLLALALLIAAVAFFKLRR